MNRVQIRSCSPSPGNLYEVPSEDGVLVVYDWSFVATTLDGRAFAHRSHAVRGAVQNPEGFMVANYAHRQNAEAFAGRVEARGSIDPSLWQEVDLTPPDLRESLAAEAERERLERAGLPF